MSTRLLTAKQSKVWLLYVKLRLSGNILREVCSYLRPVLFPYIHQDHVYVYNHDTHMCSERLLYTSFYGCTFVVCEDNSMMCVGDSPKSVLVRSLNLTSLELTDLHSMHLPREAAGVIRIDICVYVFGGRDEKSCEVYELQEWKEVGAMQCVRCYFTPCFHRSVIYLAGYAAVVESFDAVTHTFTPLLLYLPSTLHRCKSIAFIANGELCILAVMQIARWKVESEQEFCISSTDRNSSSSQTPLVLAGEVLIAHNEKGLSFSLETYAFV